MALVLPANQDSPRTSEGPSQREWQKHRETITKLYLRGEKSLTDLVKIMAERHHFYATRRMFKFRFKTWKLDRNLRSDEVLAMTRVETRRKTLGIGSDFWRHGRPVTPSKLERYLRDHLHVAQQLKKHAPQDTLMKGHIEALLPPHIVVTTPSKPLIFDQKLHSIESILGSLQCYLQENFCQTRELFEDNPCLVEPELSVYRATTLLAGEIVPQEATISLLSKRFFLLQDELLQDGIVPFLTIFWNYLLIKDDHPEIAMLWLNHARDMCIAIKGLNNPLLMVIFLVSNSINHSDVSNTLEIFCSVGYDNILGYFGNEHEITLNLSRFFLGAMGALGVSSDVISYRNWTLVELWMRKTEIYPSNEEAIENILQSSQHISPQQQKTVLSWLDDLQWRKLDSLSYRSCLYLALLYLRIGDYDKSVPELLQSFQKIRNVWSRTSNDFQYLAYLVTLTDFVSETIESNEINLLKVNLNKFLGEVRDFQNTEDARPSLLQDLY